MPSGPPSPQRAAAFSVISMREYQRPFLPFEAGLRRHPVPAPEPEKLGHPVELEEHTTRDRVREARGPPPCCRRAAPRTSPAHPRGTAPSPRSHPSSPAVRPGRRHRAGQPTTTSSAGRTSSLGSTGAAQLVDSSPGFGGLRRGEERVLRPRGPDPRSGCGSGRRSRRRSASHRRTPKSVRGAPRRRRRGCRPSSRRVPAGSNSAAELIRVVQAGREDGARIGQCCGLPPGVTRPGASAETCRASSRSACASAARSSSTASAGR